MITEREPHLRISSKGKNIPAYAEVPDFGGNTAAKNAYWMAQLLPPFMEIYSILEEIKSQYPSSTGSR